MWAYASGFVDFWDGINNKMYIAGNIPLPANDGTSPLCIFDGINWKFQAYKFSEL